jgi:hypothetical protein
MPKVNMGFNYGQRGYSPVEAEDNYSQLELRRNMTPHERGVFRKGYWSGRVVETTDDIRGCLRYMRRIEDIKTLEERLEAVYKQTLVDMYGEEQAEKFLVETRRAMSV